MNRYKLIIFDFDGTLIDTSNIIIRCFLKTFQKFNQKHPSQYEIRSVIGLTLQDSFRILTCKMDRPIDMDFWVKV